jgi:hypothetical protein
MNEVFYTVFFGILIGHLAIFWGIGIASVLLSYVSDGEKNFKAFYDPVKWGMPEFIDDFICGEVKTISFHVKLKFGFIIPFFTGILFLGLSGIDSKCNLNIGIAITSISAAIFITLRLARKIYRVSTLIKAHVNDKQAHK